VLPGDGVGGKSRPGSVSVAPETEGSETVKDTTMAPVPGCGITMAKLGRESVGALDVEVTGETIWSPAPDGGVPGSPVPRGAAVGYPFRSGETGGRVVSVRDVAGPPRGAGEKQTRFPAGAAARAGTARLPNPNATVRQTTAVL